MDETQTITQRAEKWIADSWDDTEELQAAAEIMVGLMAEIEKCKQSAIKLEYREIEQKAAEFFDWPTNNRDFVTSTSAILFAVSMIQAYCHSDEAVEKENKVLLADCRIMAEWILGFARPSVQDDTWFAANKYIEE